MLINCNYKYEESKGLLMSNILRYGTAGVAIILAIIILNCIRKNRLNLKYSLIWLATLLAILIAVLIPNLLEEVAKFLGFEVMSNMLFLVAIITLILITLSLTMIVSKQSKMIQLLIQEVSMLKANQKGEKK